MRLSRNVPSGEGWRGGCAGFLLELVVHLSMPGKNLKTFLDIPILASDWKEISLIASGKAKLGAGGAAGAKALRLLIYKIFGVVDLRHPTQEVVNEVQEKVVALTDGEPVVTELLRVFKERPLEGIRNEDRKKAELSWRLWALRAVLIAKTVTDVKENYVGWLQDEAERLTLGAIECGLALGIPEKLNFLLAQNSHAPHDSIDEDLLRAMSSHRKQTANEEWQLVPFRLASSRSTGCRSYGRLLSNYNLTWAGSIHKSLPRRLQAPLNWMINCYFAEHEARICAPRARTSRAELKAAALAFRKDVLRFLKMNAKSSPNDPVYVPDIRRLQHPSEEVEKILGNRLAGLKAVIEGDTSVHMHPGRFVYLFEEKELPFFRKELVPFREQCILLREYFRKGIVAFGDQRVGTPGADESQIQELAHLCGRIIQLLNHTIRDPGYREYVQAMIFTGLKACHDVESRFMILHTTLLWLSAGYPSGVWEKQDLYPAFLYFISPLSMGVKRWGKVVDDWKRIARVPHWRDTLFEALRQGAQMFDEHKEKQARPSELFPLLFTYLRNIHLAPGVLEALEQTVKAWLEKNDPILELEELRKVDTHILHSCVFSSEETQTPVGKGLALGRAVISALDWWKAKALPLISSSELDIGSNFSGWTAPLEAPSAYCDPLISDRDYDALCTPSDTSECKWLAELEVSPEYISRLKQAFEKTKPRENSSEEQIEHRDMLSEAIAYLSPTKAETTGSTNLVHIFGRYMSPADIIALRDDLDSLDTRPSTPKGSREKEFGEDFMNSVKEMDIEHLVTRALAVRVDVLLDGVPLSFEEPTKSCVKLVSRLRQDFNEQMRAMTQRNNYPSSLNETQKRRQRAEILLIGLSVSRHLTALTKAIADEKWRAYLFLHICNVATFSPYEEFSQRIAREDLLNLEPWSKNPSWSDEEYARGPFGESLGLFYDFRDSRRLPDHPEKEKAPSAEDVTTGSESLRLSELLATYKVRSKPPPAFTENASVELTIKEWSRLSDEEATELVADALGLARNQTTTFHSIVGHLLRNKRELQGDVGKKKAYTLLEACATLGLSDALKQKVANVTAQIARRKIQAKEQARMPAEIFRAGQALAWLTGLDSAIRTDTAEDYLKLTHEAMHTEKTSDLVQGMKRDPSTRIARSTWLRFQEAQEVEVSPPTKRSCSGQIQKLPQTILTSCKRMGFSDSLVAAWVEDRHRFVPIVAAPDSDVLRTFEFFRAAAHGGGGSLSEAAWYKKFISSLERVKSRLKDLPSSSAKHGLWLWTVLFFDLEDLLAQGIAGRQARDIEKRYMAAFEHLRMGRGFLNPRVRKHDSAGVEKILNELLKAHDPERKIPMFRPFMLLGLEDARMDAYTQTPTLTPDERRWIRARTANVKTHSEYVSANSEFLTSQFTPTHKYEAGDGKAERWVANRLVNVLCTLDSIFEDIDFKFFYQAMLVGALRDAETVEERLSCLERAAAWLEERLSRGDTATKDVWTHDLADSFGRKKTEPIWTAFRNCPAPLLRPASAPGPLDVEVAVPEKSSESEVVEKVHQRRSSSRRSRRPQSLVATSSAHGSEDSAAEREQIQPPQISTQGERAIHSLYEWDALLFSEGLRCFLAGIDPSSSVQTEAEGLSGLIRLLNRYRNQEWLNEGFYSWVLKSEEFAYLTKVAEESGTPQLQSFLKRQPTFSDELLRDIQELQGAMKTMPRMVKDRLSMLERLRKIFNGSDKDGRRRYPISNSLGSETLQGKGKQKNKSAREVPKHGSPKSASEEIPKKSYLQSLPAKLADYCKSTWPEADKFRLTKYMKKTIWRIEELHDEKLKHSHLLLLEATLGRATLTLIGQVKNSSPATEETRRRCETFAKYYLKTGDPLPFLDFRLRTNRSRLKLQIFSIPVWNEEGAQRE